MDEPSGGSSGPTDDSLLARIAGGAVEPFDQFVDRHKRRLMLFVYHRVGDVHRAEDLTQDVFVRAWKALPRLEAPEAFTSWLYRIATNLTRNWIRDNTRVRQESLDQPFADDEEGGGREIADVSSDPAAAAQARDVQEVVQRAVEGLSPDHRMVITLHHLDGMPVEEIAHIMKCSVGTVKSRLSRARDHLRRKLAGFVEG